MKYKDKLILTDADGVLVDWEWAFQVWMTERGYQFKNEGKKNYYLHHHYQDMTQQEIKKLVKFFNESAAIGFLATVTFGMLLTFAIRIPQIRKQEREVLELEARRDQLNDIFVGNE